MLDFSSYFKNKEQKNEFFIALLVLFLFGLFLSYLIPSLDLNQDSNPIEEHQIVSKDIKYYITKKKADNSATLSLWVDDLENKNIRNTNHLFSKNKDTSIIAIKKEIANTTFEKKPKAILDPKEIVTAVDTIYTTIDQPIRETVEVAEDKEIEDINTSTSKERLLDPIVEKKMAINEKPVTKETEIQPKRKEINTPTQKPNSTCVIVLGAFSDKKNLRSLKTNVLEDIDAKYLYEGKRKTYNVIGIYVDCLDYDRKLSKYKAKYAKKAWLLKLN